MRDQFFEGHGRRARSNSEACGRAKALNSCSRSLARAALLTGRALAPAPALAQSSAAAEARAIAKEAYIYGFPIVDNYRIQYSYFVDRGSPEYKAPWNEIANIGARLHAGRQGDPDAQLDTPYSYLGADLRAEPMVITVPADRGGPLLLAASSSTCTPSTSPTSAAAPPATVAAASCSPGRAGRAQTPKGVKRGDPLRDRVRASSLYRTQLFNPADIDNVKKIQAGYKVQPLSAVSRPARAGGRAGHRLPPAADAPSRSAPRSSSSIS